MEVGLGEYRFFKLNFSGVVDTADRLRLPDDEAAVVHARVFGNGSTVEVWAGARKLAVVPPSVRTRSALSAQL